MRLWLDLEERKVSEDLQLGYLLPGQSGLWALGLYSLVLAVGIKQ